MELISVPKRLVLAILSAFKPAWRTIRFLLSVMLPVSLAVVLLERSGLMFLLADHLSPIMRHLGLSGQASLVFLSSVLLNIYSAIAVIETLALGPREVVILATMCLIAHNLVVECAVMKKTGSSVTKMAFLRISIALLAGFLLNLVLPKDAAAQAVAADLAVPPSIGIELSALPIILKVWALDSLALILKISLIIVALMIGQRILEEFGLLDLLGKIMSPFMLLIGLPSSTSFLWIVANVVGLAYGSAILIERSESGKIPTADADLFNHHAAISHSLLEDTLLFGAIGVPIALAILPRFCLAIILVWIEKVRRFLFRRSFRVGIVAK